MEFLLLKEIVQKTGGGISFVTYRPEFNYYGTSQLPTELLDRTFDIVETKVKPLLEGTRIKVDNVTCRYEALKHDTRTYSECRATGLFLEVAPDGKEYLCCDRNFHPEFWIGNLNRQTVEEIQKGKERRALLDYAKMNKCQACPPACKSHEMNKQFEQVEQLRAKGEMYKVKVWIEEHRKTPKPKMVNF